MANATASEEQTIVEEYNQIRMAYKRWYAERAPQIPVPSLRNDFGVILEMLERYEEWMSKELGV